MAKKSTSRQQPSKPQSLPASETRSAMQDAADAQSEGAAIEQKNERSKEEIEAGKKRGKYEVLTEGAIFDGETKCKVGDVVTLTADEAVNHRAHGVALVEK